MAVVAGSGASEPEGQLSSRAVELTSETRLTASPGVAPLWGLCLSQLSDSALSSVSTAAHRHTASSLRRYWTATITVTVSVRVAVVVRPSPPPPPHPCTVAAVDGAHCVCRCCCRPLSSCGSASAHHSPLSGAAGGVPPGVVGPLCAEAALDLPAPPVFSPLLAPAGCRPLPSPCPPPLPPPPPFLPLCVICALRCLVECRE